jgi:hypothetical protein
LVAVVGEAEQLGPSVLLGDDVDDDSGETVGMDLELGGDGAERGERFLSKIEVNWKAIFADSLTEWMSATRRPVRHPAQRPIEDDGARQRRVAF